MTLKLTPPDPLPARPVRRARDPRETIAPQQGDALWLYQRFDRPVAEQIRRKVAKRVFGDARRSLLDAIEGDYNHPALVEELGTWWREVNIDGVLQVVDFFHNDDRARVLASLLCVEGHEYLEIPTVERVLFARLAAYVRGENEFEDVRGIVRGRFASAAERLARWGGRQGCVAETLGVVSGDWARQFFGDALEEVHALWFVSANAAAHGLRELFPDPLRIDARSALTRWDSAVAAFRSHIPTRDAIQTQLEEIVREILRGP